MPHSPPRPLATSHLLIISGFVHFVHFTERKPYSMWSFVPGFFHSAYCFQGSPCCSMYRYFIPFYSWIIFHCRTDHILCIDSYTDAHLGCLTLWTVMCAQKLLCGHISFLLGRYLGGEVFDQTVTLCVEPFEAARLFPRVAVPFCIPPATSQSSHSLTNTSHHLAFCFSCIGGLQWQLPTGATCLENSHYHCVLLQ